MEEKEEKVMTEPVSTKNDQMEEILSGQECHAEAFNVSLRVPGEKLSEKNCSNLEDKTTERENSRLTKELCKCNQKLQKVQENSRLKAILALISKESKIGFEANVPKGRQVEVTSHRVLTCFTDVLTCCPDDFNPSTGYYKIPIEGCYKVKLVTTQDGKSRIQMVVYHYEHYEMSLSAICNTYTFGRKYRNLGIACTEDMFEAEVFLKENDVIFCKVLGDSPYKNMKVTLMDPSSISCMWVGRGEDMRNSQKLPHTTSL